MAFRNTTHISPLAVSPLEAGRLLSLGISRVYALMRAGELQSYQDSRTRRITMESIVAYIERQLATTRTEGWRQWEHSPPRRREQASRATNARTDRHESTTAE